MKVSEQSKWMRTRKFELVKQTVVEIPAGKLTKDKTCMRSQVQGLTKAKIKGSKGGTKILRFGSNMNIDWNLGF